MKKVIVRKGVYRDSITLLRVSQGVGRVEGVSGAAVVMATPLNRRVLSDMGFAGPEANSATTDDLVIALEARDAASLNAAVAETDELLAAKVSGGPSMTADRTLGDALTQNPESNIAVISVPGAYAAREAENALKAGLNVFLFSSNVSRDDELRLKQFSTSHRLLLMGPDCGTSILNHVVFGFGNSIRDGPIGIVSASGTGLQEVSTIIHRNGLGISQAIGTGGADLSDAVGGLTTIQALYLLSKDPHTKVIVVISKPPGEKTLKAVLSAVKRIRKPVVLTFLGSDVTVKDGNHRSVPTLKQAAAAASELCGGSTSGPSSRENARVAFEEASKLSESQKYVRGLYAGGTLCYEAQVVLSPVLGRVYSNAPLDKKDSVEGTAKVKGNSCIDLGAEEFVVGRAHPMIDFTLRKLRIAEEAKDPQVAVILLDVELGIGSNADPAAELVPSIEEAKALATRNGRHLSFVASVLGTDTDFQGLARQKAALLRAGVTVASTNADAAELAALIASRGISAGRRSR